MIKVLQIGEGDFWRTCSLISMLLLACLPESVQAQGKDDFNDTSNKGLSYTSRKTLNGWTAVNTAAVINTTNGHGALLNADETAFCINGKTSGIGVITSPVINRGCGTLSLNYGYGFNESNGVSFKIEIKQNGVTQQTYNVVNADAVKSTKYQFNTEVNLEGTFQIVITNNCPSAKSDENADRVSIWNITWTGYGEDALKTPSYTWSTLSYTYTLGKDFTPPTINSIPSDLTVSFTSSDEDVATVNENGVITLAENAKAGETIITASNEEGDIYYSHSTKCIITVNNTTGPEDPENPDRPNIEGIYYELVTSNSGLVKNALYLIGNAENGVVMGYQKDSNRQGISITVNDNTIQTQVATVKGNTTLPYELQLYGANGTWTFYDNTYPGYLYAASTSANQLKTSDSKDLNEKQKNATITFEEGGIASIKFAQYDGRNMLQYYNGGTSNLFSCYATSSSQKPIQLFIKKANRINISSAGYATYYSEADFVLPDGLTAGIITGTQNGMLTIDYCYTAGSTVPANTGVIIKGAQGNYPCIMKYNTLTAPTNNLLHGDITAYTPKDQDCNYYKLANGEDGLGFYWGAENGSPFESGAFKAYLAVPKTEANVNARALLLDELETGIAHVSADDDSTSVNVYSLDGRCVRTNAAPATALNGLQKGLYIVNGKKYIVK